MSDMKVATGSHLFAIWTLVASAAICAGAPTSRTQEPSDPPSNSQSDTNRIGPASGRLIVQAPTVPLHLGEKNPIEITLKGPDLACLTIMNNADESCSQVQRRPDGTTYIEVMPIQLGEIELGFMAKFADSSMELETVKVTVVPGHPPKRLYVGSMIGGLGNPNAHRSIEYLTVGESVTIWGEAEFEGVSDPLQIPDGELKFHVIQSRGLPAIKFDPSTGKLYAQRLGDALIESSYAGTTETTCVMVREHEIYSEGNCEELREGGDGRLPTAPGADAPGADRGSKLPYTGCYQLMTGCTVREGKAVCGLPSATICDTRHGRFIANERLDIVPPANPLNVAELNSLTLRVHGAKVARVECAHNCLSTQHLLRSIAPVLPFSSQPDGNITVQILPWQTGAVHYEISVFFKDGGVAHKAFDTDVGFGLKQPLGINMSCGNDSYPDPNLPEFLFVQDQRFPAPARDVPRINACYEGAGSFVEIPANLITYRVLSDREPSAIAVDSKTGMLTPLRFGEAVLEREFHGLKTDTCVAVLQSGDQMKGVEAACGTLRERLGLPAKLPVKVSPSQY